MIHKNSFPYLFLFVIVAMIFTHPQVVVSETTLGLPIQEYFFLDPFPTELYSTTVLKDVHGLMEDFDRQIQKDNILDALASLHQARQIAPFYYQTYTKLGEFYFQPFHHNRDYAKAVHYFEIAYHQIHNGQSFHPQDYFILLIELGEAYQQTDQYQNALTLCFELKTWMQENHLSDEFLNQFFYHNTSWIYYKMRQMDQAFSMIKEGLHELKETDNLLNTLGILYGKIHEYDQAITTYLKILNNPAIKGRLRDVVENNLGETYLSLFRFDEVVKSYQTVIDQPESYEASLTYYNQIKLFLHAGLLADAQGLINRFATLAKDRSEWYESEGLMNLLQAKIFWLSGQLDLALSYIMRAQEAPQHFGSIGFEPNNYLMEWYFTAARIYEAKSLMEPFQYYPTYSDWMDPIYRWIRSMILKRQADWYDHKALEIFISSDELLEHLFVYDSESMLDYPWLVSLIQHLPAPIIDAHLKRISEHDDRSDAQKYYRLYKTLLGFKRGETQPTEAILKELNDQFTSWETGFQIQALAGLASAYYQKSQWYGFYQTLVHLMHRMPAYPLMNGWKIPVHLVQPYDASLLTRLSQAGIIPIAPEFPLPSDVSTALNQVEGLPELRQVQGLYADGKLQSLVGTWHFKHMVPMPRQIERPITIERPADMDSDDQFLRYAVYRLIQEALLVPDMKETLAERP